jgi:hypothetical protein
MTKRFNLAGVLLLCTAALVGCVTAPESVRGGAGGGAIVIGGGSSSASSTSTAPMYPVLDDPDNNIEEWRETVLAKSYWDAVEKCQQMADDLTFQNGASLPVHYKGVSKTNSRPHWYRGRHYDREYQCIFGSEVFTPDWETSAIVVEVVGGYTLAEAQGSCQAIETGLNDLGQPAKLLSVNEIEAPYIEDGYEYSGTFGCEIEVAQ